MSGAGAGGMAVDMRRTKLSAADAALIAGEVTKPSWASRNEGIHERVSFDDTLWGFELAGGIYYNTPLRVVHVKEGSRAEQACIKKGDTVKRINDLDTSKLTLQEAHDIIVESGIHLKISVTSPDDEEDAYYTYEDPLLEDAALAEELRRAREAERVRRAIERASRACSLPWPWVRRTNIIYRESNCFLVPSKYEGKHKDQFPELPHIRYTDDISGIDRGSPVDWAKKSRATDDTEKGENVSSLADDKETDKIIDEIIQDKTHTNKTVQNKTNKVSEKKLEQKSNNVLEEILEEKEADKIIDEILEESEDVNRNIPSDVEDVSHSDADDAHTEMNGEVVGPDSEEDGAMHAVEDDSEENIETEKLETTDINVDGGDSQKEIDDSIELTEESSILDNSVDNLDVDESLEVNDEVEVNAPTSDYVNDDDAKTEDDNVVDGIVGDADSDSTKEK